MISQRTAITTAVRVPGTPPPLIRRGIVVCRPVDILLPSLHQLGRRVNRHDMRRTDVQASEPPTDTHCRRSRSQLGTDLPARNAPIPLLGLHFYLLFALDGTEAADSFFPIGIPITIWLLISVLHID